MFGVDRSETTSRLPSGETLGLPGRAQDGAGGGDTGNAQSSPPAISLPKGGGAIRGMGEKFSANPVTGTGSMSVPIFTSPGRSGFGPQLSLSYDSGAGNGPFGWGWSLSVPSITRKTDKGLPRYRDAEESDVFILSGAEDLVPALKEVNKGEWKDDVVSSRKIGTQDYEVRRYRPRTEGLFARIERWSNKDKPEDTFWRSISKDNITTWYGKTTESRIFDPADPVRVFSWLICESYDDKGNAILYEYFPEDSAGIDLTQAHEVNRTLENRSADESRSSNRYLKRVKYGNRSPNRDVVGKATDPTQLKDWMFEVVFDYGERHYEPLPDDAEGRQLVRASKDKKQKWTVRQDSFSTYRAGFEVRTYRLCRRVLMFHHFPNELGTDDYLVRSTDFTYEEDPIASFITETTQSGYLRKKDGTYLKKSWPPLEFEYSQPTVQEEVREVDPESLENLPYGLDGSRYQWLDLDGEGVSGILTEQAGAWFYKRNLSPISTEPRNGQQRSTARFGPIETVAQEPSLAGENGGGQFLDLAGDGSLDFVQLSGPVPGFYERTDGDRWNTFTPFGSLPVVDWEDPNLRFIDLTGDSHADVLITEGEVFAWHPSLAEAGFGPEERTHQPFDEERGPRLVFADGTQSIHLADCSGDGLTDLVRIRNGEVCYWPNLGYGHFGAKVTMDNAPWFDAPDLFDQRRVHLADIDGSGVTDIIYLGSDGVRLYFNRSGNSWSDVQTLAKFPRIDDFSSVMALDLLGNGTACLVWSSPLPAEARRHMRYVDLMGSQKPHLLVRVVNNLGAETRVKYAPSARFYLADKMAGKPWITKLPFPVHVVERVETRDHISRNRFVTRYAYHHGYFDGMEREFRGFGMVEQYDTEKIGTVTPGETPSEATNLDAASYTPPVLTKTWFHTGAYIGRDHISDFFAGLLDEADLGEYYREPGLTPVQARDLLLDDTMLPAGLTLEEEREACRALKGSMLRQEVYALDGTDKEQRPYTVTEQNFAVRRLQPQAGNRHAVFFTHAHESISYHYERTLIPVVNGQIVDTGTAIASSNVTWLPDPRITHALTLEVDPFGNVLKEAAISYGRRFDAPDVALVPEDRERQRLIHITYTENTFTKPIADKSDIYRIPLPADTRTYEVRKPEQEKSSNGWTNRYRFDDLLSHVKQSGDGKHDVDYEDTQFGKAKQAAANDANESKKYFRRLIEHVRTLYRKDDLTTLLPLGELGPLALPGESYKLAFTPGLLGQVYKRDGKALLPDPTNVIGGQGTDRGGYVDMDGNGHWWIPSGRTFLSPKSIDSAAQELAYARQHFFLPHRYRDPFGATTTVAYDSDDTNQAKNHNLLVVQTHDPLDNTVVAANDYRVLQPRLVTDPNRNRTQVKFDTLGMVAGTAVMGKEHEPDGKPKGDVLDGFEPDPTQAQIDAFLAQPRGAGASPSESVATQIVHDLLGKATTRIVYDLHRYEATASSANPQPVFAATITRETHVADLSANQRSKVQIGFSYSDGFGRQIHKKIQAEPGPLVDGGPTVSPRWVGSGWTIFNNKGKPVRQYEPFFSQLPDKRHQFEFGVQAGVSPILFYDPLERVVATLHPNHTYEKVVFDPWRQITYDVNDTVAANGSETGDPRTDADIRVYVAEYFESQSNTWQTWHGERITGAKGAQAKSAAEKAAEHANTPTTAHFDTLGRPFLTLAHNGFKPDGTAIQYPTRVRLDIEGNQREVRDAVEQKGDKQGRIVMLYDYDLLGNRIYQSSMEAGERWMLNDATGKPIRAWDGRGHAFTMAYDPLRRPLRSFVTGADPANPNQELLTERLVYGEQHPQDELRNLRGNLYLHLDQAGAVTNESHDFKGNPLRATRRLTNGTQYRQTVNWRAVDNNHVALPTKPTTRLDPTALKAALASRLEIETFTSRTTYDALNRPVQTIAPRSDQPGAKRNVIQPAYNEANLLERVHVWLEYPAEPAGLLDAVTVPPSAVGVSNIDYDAKGQRLRIEYRNGASTRYTYDPETFRLIHLYTRRGVAFTEDCENPQPPPPTPPPTIAAPEKPPEGRRCGLQNLHYTHDPVGNITHIRDDAQQTLYFSNKRVEPSAEYTYDALYRLIDATGREHLGQAGGAPIPHSYFDAPRVGRRLLHPGDGNAMGNYTERYVYDAVGNFQEMIHRGTDPMNPGWTCTYAYGETSLIEDGKGGTLLKRSNRLSGTSIGTTTETYSAGGNGYDSHGNMLRMPQLQVMQWDFKDQLQMTQRQAMSAADDEGRQRQGERTHYVYDSAGQRVRKVTELATGQVKDERVYLGGFEIYRRRGTDALVRETLHIMDDKQRLALVETRTLGNEQGVPVQLIRYQFGNHLGSACLELDDKAQIISYEEYTPYGSTAFQAVRSAVEVSLKRYRYTSKERDEESGLYYHGARYYTPWLGRWVSCDPIGISDGINNYGYVNDNPVCFTDPSGRARNLESRDPTMPTGREQAEGRSIPEEHKSSPYPDWLPEKIGDHLVRAGPGTYMFEAYSEIGDRVYRTDIVAVVRNRGGDFSVFQMTPSEEDMGEIIGDEDIARRHYAARKTKEAYVLKYLEEGRSLDDALGLYRAEVEIDFKLSIWAAASATMGAAGMQLTQRPPILIPHSGPVRPTETRPQKSIYSGRELWRSENAQERTKFPPKKANEEKWDPRRITEREGVTPYSRTGDPYHEFPYAMERETVQHGWATRPPQRDPSAKPGYVQFSKLGTVNGNNVRFEVGGYLSRSGNVFVITHRFARRLYGE